MIYRDKNERQITREKWLELQAKPHYTEVERFERRGFAVVLSWVGTDERSAKFDANPEMQYRLFGVEAMSTDDGLRLPRLQDERYTFATLEEAQVRYRELVARHCHTTDESMNEYEEPLERRHAELADDPTRPDLGAYGDAGAYA